MFVNCFSPFSCSCPTPILHLFSGPYWLEDERDTGPPLPKKKNLFMLFFMDT